MIHPRLTAPAGGSYAVSIEYPTGGSFYDFAGPTPQFRTSGWTTTTSPATAGTGVWVTLYKADIASPIAQWSDGLYKVYWHDVNNGNAIVGATEHEVVLGDEQPSRLTSSGLDAILPEPGINFRQSQSLILAACTGVLTGVPPVGIGGVIIVKGAGVITTRIQTTVDAAGDRTNVTLSPPP